MLIPDVRRARRGETRSQLRAIGAVAAVLALGALAFQLIPGLGGLDPFGEETRDRSQPVLLRSLEDLSEYRAVTANLQEVVDIERDAKYLPSFIKGERVVLIAAGNVDGVVDFRGLGPRAIRVSSDRRAATITLPAARLTGARVDLKRTRVVDIDRGFLDRVGDAFGEGGDEQRQVLMAAQEKLDAAARTDPAIRRTAEDNTRRMLTTMLRGLGFERVTVRFVPPRGA